MPRLQVPSMGGGINVMRTPFFWGGCSSCANAAGASARHIASNIRQNPLPSEIEVSLRIVSPIEMRKEIVAPLAIGEEGFLDLSRADLIVEAGEAEKMILRAFRRVVARCAGLHEESPVARLR